MTLKRTPSKKKATRRGNVRDQSANSPPKSTADAAETTSEVPGDQRCQTPTSEQNKSPMGAIRSLDENADDKMSQGTSNTPIPPIDEESLQSRGDDLSVPILGGVPETIVNFVNTATYEELRERLLEIESDLEKRESELSVLASLKMPDAPDQEIKTLARIRRSLESGRDEIQREYNLVFKAVESCMTVSEGRKRRIGSPNKITSIPAKKPSLRSTNVISPPLSKQSIRSPPNKKGIDKQMNPNSDGHAPLDCGSGTSNITEVAKIVKIPPVAIRMPSDHAAFIHNLKTTVCSELKAKISNDNLLIFVDTTQINIDY